jgi:predicted DNA-binding transcriptional regulator AlpA
MAKKKPINHNKYWTPEQDEQLEEYYGIRDLAWIAKKLGKTEVATRKRIRKIRKLDSDSYYIQLVEVARQLQVPRATIYRWAEKEGLPHKKIKLSFERERYFVDMDEVWEWLKEHPNKWNAGRLETFAFGYEPEWVREKRRADILTVNQGKRWSKADKEKAWVMWAAGKSYKEMALYFKRTENSMEIMLQFYRAEKAGKPFKDRRYADVDTL